MNLFVTGFLGGPNPKEASYNLHSTFKQTNKSFSRKSLISPYTIQGMNPVISFLAPHAPSGLSSLDIFYVLLHRKVKFASGFHSLLSWSSYFHQSWDRK